MEQLIPIASKLQDVLGALGQTTSLDLPQIVVVGGQSSGKSSVLESLVGRSFLPRGTGIVTRCPLILQLFNTQQQLAGDDREIDEKDENDNVNEKYYDLSDGNAEWGEFLHIPGKRFYNFSDIRQEIVAETERITGKNRGIDSTPIHLKVFSPHVLSLTVVDLPGMAKNPVGDQPDDIEKQIRDMCMEFISNPNAIILAVTSANTDLANSDAIKLAQSVDPQGNRTVGVLTKVDLMDPGTDCAAILMNKVIPLRKGYIAVVNRGQKDILGDVPIREGLKKEERFFRHHPVYSHDRTLMKVCGTDRLSRFLNNMLMHHIRDCLPDLKNRIAHMMVDVEQELEALGTPTHDANRSTRGAALLRLLSKFSGNFTAILEGKGGQKTVGRDHYTELNGGARISYVFQDIFSSSLLHVGAFDGLSDEEIRMTICNANGMRPALFVPEISFDILVRRQIARLEQPGIQCVDLVYEELQRIASESEPNELTRFPVLRERMTEVVLNLLRRCVGPTQMMVSNLVKMELAYINTSHPDFIGGSRAVSRLMDKFGKEKENGPKRLPVAGVPNSHGSGTPFSHSSIDNFEQEGVDDEMNMVSGPPGEIDTSVDPNGNIMNLLFRDSKNVGYNNSRVSATPNGRMPMIASLPQVPDTMKQTDVPLSDRERVEMEVIKSLIESYFGIVSKNFIDMVPKTIMYFLVNHCRDSLQNELVSELYRDAEMGSLMQEAEDVAARRKACLDMRDLLGKASEIVNEVRDFNSFK